MRKTIILTLLALIGFIGYAQTQKPVLIGDLNHDNVIDVADQIILSNIILENENAEAVQFDHTNASLTFKTIHPAQLVSGPQFNAALKQLVVSTDNVWSISIQTGVNPSGTTLVSDPASQVPVYARYDEENSRIYVETEADELRFAPDCSGMFSGFQNAWGIDWSTANINTARVTNLSHFFDGCRSLSTYSLAQLDPTHVNDMSYMFAGCSALHFFYFPPEFKISDQCNTDYIFQDAYPELQPGTLAPVIACTQAVKDKLTASLGFPTFPYNWNIICARLLDGQAFQAALKQLVYPDKDWEGTTTPISVIAFHRGTTEGGCLVSTELSEFEARATYNDLTHTVDIYIDDDYLIFPSSCREMFAGRPNLTKIDWSEFGDNVITSSVTDMMGMFSGCPQLTSLDLTCFETASVYDMSGMFYNCQTLTELDLTCFNTAHVNDMSSMFCNCPKLTKLNLGKNFVINNGCNIRNFLYGVATQSQTPCCTITCTDDVMVKLTNVENNSGIDTVGTITWNIIP